MDTIKSNEFDVILSYQYFYTWTMKRRSIVCFNNHGWGCKDDLKLLKYDDPKVKLSLLPWIIYSI